MYYIEKRKNTTHNDMLLLHILPTIIIFIAFITVTLLSWQSANTAVQKELQQLITNANNDTATFIQRRINTYENILRGARGLMSTTPSANSESWKNYLASYDIASRYPGVQGIGYVVAIAPSELQQHIQSQQASGLPSYTVFPEGERDTYTSIVFLEPQEDKNNRAIGYDMFSEDTRRRAMEQARDSGQIAVSDIVTLVQDEGETGEQKQPGFLLYLAVYIQGLPTNNTEERRAALQGFVYAPFRSYDLIDTAYASVTGNNEDYYGFRITNQNAPQPEVIYTSRNYDSIMSQRGSLQQSSNITYQSGKWQIKGVLSASSLRYDLQNRPSSVLFGGITLSFFIAGFIYLLLVQRSRIIAEKEEKSLQAAKDELLALASHQLRTPATGVKQYIGMIRDGFAGKTTSIQKQLLNKAYDSNERQLATINEMLFVARADAGYLKMDTTKLNVSELVNDIVEEISGTIANKQQQLKVFLPKKPIYILADQQYLRMAFENILSNATKYTPNGGNITVELKYTVNDITYTVTDSGLGVAITDHHLLFKKFSRIPNELTNKVSGSGIGLYLAKKVVTSHGGTIEFISQPQHGSTVVITLPKSAH